jgi:SAM-dependent methyltransferase
MKEFFKSILKAVKLYHPLQGLYRQILFNARHSRIKKEYAAFKGSGFTCNACGASYQRFAPDHPSAENKNAILDNKVVAGYGENIFCPECMSTARVIAMLDKMNLFQVKVLHLSPEKKILHFLNDRNAAVVSADLMPGFYKGVDKHIQQADATKLPFDKEVFDLVIANHMLEHIPDDTGAMKEIYRVLKKDGQAILQVPFSATIEKTIEEPLINNPRKQAALFGQKDHVRIYRLNDYLDRLKETGFEVEYIPYESLSGLYIHAIQKGEGFMLIRK